MDLKNSPQPNQNPIPEPRPAPTPEPAIRTMQKDLARLAQEAGLPTKKARLPLPAARPGEQAAPPEKLPMAPKPIESFRGPSQPAKPEEKPLILAKKPTYFSLRFILITLILIVIALGGFLYWWNYIRVITPPTHYECQNYQCLLVEEEGIDQCFSDADCAPPEPTIPTSLIPVNQTKIIELAKGQENLLMNKLKTAAAKEQVEGTLRRILIKSINGQAAYLTLAECFEILEINTPIFKCAPEEKCPGANLLSQLEDNLTLFFYSQTEGNRIGLVAKIKDVEQIQSLMKYWETTLFTDLRPIFLETEIGPAAFEEFQDNIYQDVAIRYMNFPNPDLTIDYAIVDDKLVITTSKASIYAVIDALLE